jgi:hypothetical protein
MEESARDVVKTERLADSNHNLTERCKWLEDIMWRQPIDYGDESANRIIPRLHKLLDESETETVSITRRQLLEWTYRSSES